MALTGVRKREYNKAYRLANKDKVKAYRTAYRLANKEKLNADHKVYRLANKEQIYKSRRTAPQRFSLLKSHARKRGLEVTISYTDYCLLISQPCTYCDISLLNYTGYTLDRIDNSKGYIQDNVLPCCPRCNMVRNDLFSYSEMLQFIAPVIRLIDQKRKAEGDL